jgi:hypothetical protein
MAKKKIPSYWDWNPNALPGVNAGDTAAKKDSVNAEHQQAQPSGWGDLGEYIAELGDFLEKQYAASKRPPAELPQPIRATEALKPLRHGRRSKYYQGHGMGVEDDN